MGWIKSWKTLGLWAALGLLVSGLSGGLASCGPNSGPSGAPNAAAPGGAKADIEFWTMQLQPQFTDYFKALIASFEQQNPNTHVNWVDVPWSGMSSKIQTAVAAKTVPDVVNLNPDFAAALAQRGALLTLDGKVSAAEQQAYLPNIWQASRLDGKTFGLPWYLTTRVTIYNQDLLQKAGIAKPPTTFAELFQAAPVIKAKTGKYAFFATLVPADSGEVMESFVQRGVTLVDAQGKAAFNTPQGKAVFQDWVTLYKQGLMPKEALTEGHRYAIDLYQRGDSALLQSSPEFFKAIGKNAPAIAQVSAPAAQITGESGKKNVAVMNLVIPRDAKQPDAALKFALFVTNNDNQLAFAKAANVLPSTVKALQDPYFTQLPAQPTPIDQARMISAAQMKDATVLLPAMKNMKQLQKAIYENLQAAMLDQKPVDQAIGDAAQAWNQESAP
jgi:putative chitobiose transport system substrate-binding protein